jgi:hypothetical protein
MSSPDNKRPNTWGFLSHRSPVSRWDLLKLTNPDQGRIRQVKGAEVITRSWTLLGVLSLLLWVPPDLLAQNAPERTSPAFSFRFDNDVLTGTDRCYTGGLTLGWQSVGIPDPEARPWIAWLPLEMGPEAATSVSLTVGKKIYTPDNIRESDLIEEDRPYAGILYLTLGVPLRSPRHQRLAELTIGIVGHSSGGQSSQALIHRAISGIDPQGWDNQLKNEPLLELTYEHKWKAVMLRKPGGFGAEIIPHYGAGVGNLSVFRGVGLSLWSLSLNYEYVYWARKFKTETRDQTFSSLFFSLSY